jgi:hypothetical protein
MATAGEACSQCDKHFDAVSETTSTDQPTKKDESEATADAPDLSASVSTLDFVESSNRVPGYDYEALDNLFGPFTLVEGAYSDSSEEVEDKTSETSPPPSPSISTTQTSSIMPSSTNQGPYEGTNANTTAYGTYQMFDPKHDDIVQGNALSKFLLIPHSLPTFMSSSKDMTSLRTILVTSKSNLISE